MQMFSLLIVVLMPLRERKTMTLPPLNCTHSAAGGTDLTCANMLALEDEGKGRWCLQNGNDNLKNTSLFFLSKLSLLCVALGVHYNKTEKK